MGSQTGLPEPFYGEEQTIEIGHSPLPAPMPMKAPHIGHQHHLCHYADTGHVTLEEMKTLIKDPKFICKKCGRAAAREENLCEPTPL